MIPPKYWSPTKKLMVLGAMAGGKLVEDTATGNPLTFTTDKAKPLKSLLIPFTPRQEGTGDPSPQNVRSIVPWNGLSVFGGGKSVIQFVTTELKITTTTYNGYSGWCDQLTIEPAFIGKKVTYSVEIDATDSEGQTNAVAVWAYRKNGGWQYIGEKGNNIAMGTKGLSTVTVTLYSTIEWIAFGLNVQKGTICRNPMVELGQTATAYEPFVPIAETAISFPSPVYGGTLDVVSGVLTVEWGAVRADAFSWETSIITSKGQAFMTTGSVSVPFAPWQNEKGQAFAMSNAMVKNSFDGTFDGAPANSFWWNNGRSGYRCVFDENASIQDLMQFFTDNDVVFCGKLATPQEITLTPEQLTALIGNNTIWSDADGSMTAVYLKKG